MPTKRVPIARSHTSSLAAGLALYRAALEARKRWRRTGSDADHDAVIEAEKDVDRALLGPQRLWKVSIWDIDSVDRRSIYRRDKPPSEARVHDSWAEAVELLQA